jgi:hypothetical protein
MLRDKTKEQACVKKIKRTGVEKYEREDYACIGDRGPSICRKN